MDLLSSAKRDAVPFYFRRLVRHYDHSRLQLVNQMARAAGVNHDVHKEVRPLPEDNGERFYGDYYLELLEREKTVPVTQDNKRCLCGACSGSMTPLAFEMVKPAASTCADDKVSATARKVTSVPTNTTTGIARAFHKPAMAPVKAQQQCPPVGFWSSSFLGHPPPLYYYAAPAYHQLPPQSLPFVLAHQQQLLANQQQALWPIAVSSSQQPTRRRKPKVVEYQRCCKKYWKYHVVDKPEGRMGAPPHCLDCPVRKQRRHPNRGPKGPR
jgi:hypothetical protein